MAQIEWVRTDVPAYNVVGVRRGGDPARRGSYVAFGAHLDHIGVRLLTAGVAILAASLAVGSVYWLRDVASVNLTKLFVTLAVWAAYSTALGLRLGGRLLAGRFAWTCLGLFAAALLSLGPVDRSRHPAAPRAAATPTR